MKRYIIEIYSVLAPHLSELIFLRPLGARVIVMHSKVLYNNMGDQNRIDQFIVGVGAMIKSKIKCNMLNIVKAGGSSLTTSFHLYFLKLRSCKYTLPPLIKRRNKGNF